MSRRASNVLRVGWIVLLAWTLVAVSDPWPSASGGEKFRLLPNQWFVIAINPHAGDGLCLRSSPADNGILATCNILYSHQMLPGRYSIYGMTVRYRSDLIIDAADNFTYQLCVGPMGDLSEFCDTATTVTLTPGSETWSTAYVLLKNPTVRTLATSDAYYMVLRQLSHVDADLNSDVTMVAWVYLSNPDRSIAETGGFVEP